jgi:hypothetical protein
VVGEELRPPHVRAHVAAVGGGVQEQITEPEVVEVDRPVVVRVEHAEHEPGRNRDDAPTDCTLPARARLIVLVEGLAA